MHGSRAEISLHRIKALHTLVWALFAACILAIPILTWRGNLRASFVLIAIVAVEVAVLMANGMRCPLTGVAARYTEQRQDNFDIYLPLWLARYNKHIFGTFYLAGVIYALVAVMS